MRVFWAIPAVTCLVAASVWLFPPGTHRASSAQWSVDSGDERFQYVTLLCDPYGIEAD